MHITFIVLVIKWLTIRILRKGVGQGAEREEINRGSAGSILTGKGEELQFKSNNYKLNNTEMEQVLGRGVRAREWEGHAPHSSQPHRRHRDQSPTQTGRTKWGSEGDRQ